MPDRKEKEDGVKYISLLINFTFIIFLNLKNIVSKIEVETYIINTRQQKKSLVETNKTNNQLFLIFINY